MKDFHVENWKRLLAHPIALAFPAIDSATFTELLASMRSTGWDDNHPVVIYEGKILDGLNRARSAKEAGVTPTFVEFEGDRDAAIAYAVRSNLLRRHLDSGQRAMIAEELASMPHGGKRNPKSQGASLHLESGQESMKSAAGLVRVGERTAWQARELKELDPVAASEVKEGKVKLNTALRRAKATKEAAKKAKAKDKPEDDAPRDGAERRIPERAIDALTNGAAENARIRRELNKLRKDTQAHAATIGGALVLVASIDEHFLGLTSHLKYAIPWTSCPMSGSIDDTCDDACKLCRGRQWISKSQWDGVPEAARKAAGNE